MADAPKILKTDKLNQAFPKLNLGIDNANEALKRSKDAETVATQKGNEAITKAEGAISTANTAKQSADSTRTELNAVVNRATDSDAMSRQAAVNFKGEDKENLKARLDDDYNTIAADIDRKGLDIKKLGAIGDGNSHPLSEFFPTLALARMKYPHVTSLSQQIDWAALVLAINTLANGVGGLVEIPAGNFRMSNPVPLPEEKPIQILGKGINISILTVVETMTDLFTKGDGFVVGGFVKDITINGNYKARRCFVIRNYKQLTLNRIYAKNFTQDMWVFGGGTHLFYEAQISQCFLEYEPNSLENRPDYGINFINGASDNHITDLVVKNTKIAGIRDISAHNNFSKIHVYGHPYEYSPNYALDLHGKCVVSQIYSDGVKVAGIKINNDLISISNSIFFWPSGTATANTVVFEIVSGVDYVSTIGNIVDGISPSTHQFYRFLGTRPKTIVSFGNQPDFDFNYQTNDFTVKLADDSKTALNLNIDGSSGKESRLNFTIGGQSRWRLIKTSAAETGNNVGSNLSLTRWDDTGANLGTPLSINRQSGDITMTDGKVVMAGTWQKPLMLGTYALWIDSTSHKLRIKGGTPNSESDGTVVGTQT